MKRTTRMLLVAATVAIPPAPAAWAQESGGAPGVSSGGDAPAKSDTGSDAGGASRGGEVGGGLGAGGAGPGRNTTASTDASGGTR